MKFSIFVIFLLFTFSSCNKYVEKGYLTKKEIEKDCKELKKYLKNAYILYDENLNQSPELENIDKNIAKNLKLTDSSKISVRDFQNEIVRVLQNNITIPDSHLRVFSSDKVNCIFSHNNVYFTNIIFQENNGQYFVLQDFSDDIQKGDIYTGKTENLYKILLQNGTTAYQYGVKTSKKIKNCFISINNQNIQVQILKENEFCSDFYDFEQFNSNNFFIKEDTLYISNIDFNFPQKILLSIPIKPEEIKNYNIVFDLRNNLGGQINGCFDYLNFFLFANTEFENINVLKKCQSNERKVLLSSEVWEANYNLSKELNISNYKLFKMKIIGFFFKVLHIKHKVESKNKTQNRPSFQKNYYPKKIIVILNKNTSSTAELFLVNLYEIAGDKITTIGENSAGCVEFMGNYRYILPNSKLGICISNTDERFVKELNNPNFRGELNGFFPDFWIISRNVYEYIDFIIKE